MESTVSATALISIEYINVKNLHKYYFKMLLKGAIFAVGSLDTIYLMDFS
jgi:hypothetical protein